MSNKLQELITKWKTQRFSEVEIQIALLTPLINEIE